MNPHYSVNNVRKLNILGFCLYYICYQYEELAMCNRPNGNRAVQALLNISL